MAHVRIYTKDHCPYCVKAKALLARKGVQVEALDVARDPAALAAMLSASNGRKTVPQIFIGERHIGGCDDLYALDAEGELDAALAAL